MIAKARIVEVQWDDKQDQFNVAPNAKVVNAHFNPESLTVRYANEIRGGNEPSGGGGQFVGGSSSTMSVELLFDTSEINQDVRLFTKDVVYLIKPLAPSEPGAKSSNRTQANVSFEWGTFIFRGVIDSMNETLDFFSEEGKPLRATVSLSLTGQEMRLERRSGQPGAQSLSQVHPGDSLQQMAARQGLSGNWKAIATANGIDNPLRMEAGALVNMNAGASFGAGASADASFGASASAGAAFGAGTAAGLSAGAQAGFSAGLGGGVGFAAGGAIGASASTGFGAEASAGAQAGFGAGASFGAEASAGFGGGASASFGAEATAGFGGGAFAGAQTGFGAEASASFAAGATAGFVAGGSASAEATFGAQASAGFGAGAFAGAGVSLLEE